MEDWGVCRTVWDFFGEGSQPASWCTAAELPARLSDRWVEPELSLCAWTVSPGQGRLCAPGFCEPVENEYLATFRIREQHRELSACAMLLAKDHDVYGKELLETSINFTEP